VREKRKRSCKREKLEQNQKFARARGIHIHKLTLSGGADKSEKKIKMDVVKCVGRVKY
jgi:hypothetical protein